MNGEAPISRRHFLALTGGALGATVLACSGLTAAGLQPPPAPFNQSSCGGRSNVEDRILVAYASRTGSTGRVAEAIAEVLCADGAAVDVRLAKEVADISSYRAVIVGSAIYMGRWMSDAVKFVERHKDALSHLPVAYFLVCLTLKDDTEENRRLVRSYLDPVMEKTPQVQPLDIGLFAGRMDYSKLSFFYRLIAKTIDAPEGDYRDWQAIQAWAGKVNGELSQGVVV